MGKSQKMLSFVHKLKTKDELYWLIKQHKILRILTNGKDVFAWDGELACHHEVSISCDELKNYANNGYANYTIENQYLCHSICKYPTIAQNFIKNWFPNSYYANNKLEYELIGINLKK